MPVPHATLAPYGLIHTSIAVFSPKPWATRERNEGENEWAQRIPPSSNRWFEASL